jgi:Uma2 family endonuclease
MIAHPRKPMTVAAFLEWEAWQELRYEFDGFQPVAMTGGTAAHAGIQRNLAISIGSRLRGTPCRFFGGDLKIAVAGSIRYPDGLVVCAPVAPDSTTVKEPVVIFEVLSAGTSSVDMITKNREYAATPSVVRYMMLSRHEIAATMFERVGADWVGHIFAADAMLNMPEIGIGFPLAELYEGVEFSDEGAGQ